MKMMHDEKKEMHMPANMGKGMSTKASGNGNRRISAGSRKTGPKVSVPKSGGWGSSGKGGKGGGSHA